MQTLDWFLKRVALIWLLLTSAAIAALLHSIFLTGGFR
jgi:hypothetical protein